MVEHRITGTVTVGTEVFGMTEALLGEAVSGKRKRPRVEDRDGTEWCYDRARPVEKRRVIDRGADRYLEWVFDPVAGELLHFDARSLRDKNRS